MRVADLAGPRGAGPLGRPPYVLPLLAYAQSQVPFVAVLASRASAEIVARLPDGEARRDADDLDDDRPAWFGALPQQLGIDPDGAGLRDGFGTLLCFADQEVTP